MSLLKEYLSILQNDGFKEANIRVLEYLFGRDNKIILYARGYSFNQDEDGHTYIKSRDTGTKFYLADESVLVEFLDETRNEYYYDEIGIEETDTVLNIGAHIGSTVIYPAKWADMVYAVEPNPETVKILRKNVANIENVEVIQAGCWNESGELELNFGENKNDDSFLDPDDGGSGGSGIVETYTIEDLMNQIDNDVSFVKIEAEGAEPEVLQGMPRSEVEKVVVKVDEERDGESPIVDVIRILDDMGYEIDCKYPYVYGRLNTK